MNIFNEFIKVILWTYRYVVKLYMLFTSLSASPRVHDPLPTFSCRGVDGVIGRLVSEEGAAAKVSGELLLVKCLESAIA